MIQKKKNVVIVLLIYLVPFFGYSQANYTIDFKDYHSVKISDIKLLEDKKHILTSDIDGKILMFDASTLEFIKTIKTSSGIPITGMHPVKNDSFLLSSQRYNNSFPSEFDSLILQSIHFEKRPSLNQRLSFCLIDLNIKGYYGELNDGNYNKWFSLFDHNFKNLYTVGISDYIHQNIISVSHDFQKVTYLGGPNIRKKEIKSLELKSGKLLSTIAVPENKDVVSLFFDKLSNDLFAIAVEDNLSKVEFYNLSSGSFGSPDYSINYSADNTGKVIINYENDESVFAFVSQSYALKPIVVVKKGKVFSHQLVDIPHGAGQAAINSQKKEVVFTNLSFEKDGKVFFVYNYRTKKIKSTFSEIVSDFYTSKFLPDNSWITRKSNVGDNVINEDIKLFERGTFHNRFGSLNFNDYLERKHKVAGYYAKVEVEKGVALIYGNGQSDDLGRYHLYDLVKDEITKVTNVKLDAITLLDYNLTHNVLLLGKTVFLDQYDDETLKVEMVVNDKITSLEGDYRLVKFSYDGKYILTINQSNKIEIKQREGFKTIYSRDLEKGNYKVFSLDNSNFTVSIKSRNKLSNNCFSKSISMSIENDEVSVEEFPCFFITEMIFKNDNVGFVIEDIGLSINNQTITFPKSHFPKTISFNKDASKFLVSFTDGKTALYSTETLKPLGYMMHPDGKSHIFCDIDNNYFSNINPEKYLTASKDGQKIAFGQVESTLFNPEKILELFDKPNNSYIVALRKAIRLRKDNLSLNDQLGFTPSNAESDNIQSEENSKPNLYLLSIGVSDYAENAHNLTFSDKDAIDMVKIYGKLSSAELKKYDDKFFGTKYYVYDQSHTPLGSINYYNKFYNRSGNKYLLNTEGNIWLDDYGKDYTIWDFKNGSVDSLDFPEFIKKGFLNDLNESIFPKPDNTGFYLIGENSQFEYNFVTKRFSPLNLPFKADLETVRPLLDDNWFYFDDQGDTLKMTISGVKSKGGERNYSLHYKNSETVFRDIKPDGTINIDTIFNSSQRLKAVSSEGRYVFYSTVSDLFFLDLHERNIIPTRLPINMSEKYACKISVDAEKKQFYILETIYELKKVITYYDFTGKILKSFKYNNYYNNDGTVNDGQSYFYVRESESLLSKSIFNKTDEVLQKVSPHSFDKVFAEYVINQNADSRRVKSRLKTFFRNASPNDQIIIFIAGHGVLDSENNYYFAPHDMEFNKIEKNGISFESIVTSLKDSPAKNKLLLMDTCHSGRTIDLETGSDKPKPELVHSNGKRGSEVKQGGGSRYKVSEVISTLFEDFLSKSGVTILSASSGADLAQEHPEWGNGAFTSSYLKTLISKMGGFLPHLLLDEKDTKLTIELNEGFMEDLYKEVMDITDGKQVPDLRELNKNTRLKAW